MKRLLLGFCTFALMAAAAWAQSAAVSQISGSVQDSSGSAVAGAQITVTQTDTSLVRIAQSGADGSYVLQSLPIGPYRMEVTKEGFSTYVQSGIVLQVNSNPTIAATLAVGSVTEHVVVEAAAAMVETQSTGVGQVIDQARVVELPLNGRNITQLIGLAGGAAYTPASGNLTSTKNYQNGEAVVSVAGGALNGVTYLLDGATHNDVFNNLNLPLPFPDALQEFKVETSALPAQYGYHSAGAVNIVTKSGSNEFHGDAFEFVRNGAFNARDFFALSRDTLKRNQYGGTLGGPIKKNKLFFFAGYQGSTVRSAPNSAFAFLPTPAMLAGDFTQVTGPGCNAKGQITLGAPFVNNTISPSKFSAPALKMLTYFEPLPTDPCGRVQYGVKSNFNEYMGVAKVDYQLSPKHSLFGRYYATHYYAPSSYDGHQITMASPFIDNLIQSAALGDTFILGPNTINSFHATMNRSAVVKAAPPFFTPVTLGIPWTVLLPDYTRVNVLPAFQSSCNVCALGAIFTTTYQAADDFSAVRGSHEMAFGVNWISPVHHSLLNGSSGGTFNFNGTVTGLPQADYMIGALSSFAQGNTQFNSARYQYLGVYAQDSWRVSSRLKVNYGIRWEPYLAGKSQYGQYTHYDQALFNQNVHSTVYPNAPAGMLFVGDPGFDTGGRPNRIKWNDFAPRIGVVWNPKGDGKMTVRASWGMFYDLPHTLFFDDFSREAPWGQNITVNNPPQGFANPWGGFPGGNPFPVVLNQNYVFRNGLYWETVPLDVKTTYVGQWNLSLQRQLGANWLASASYLGNEVSHLWGDQELNPALYIPGTCPAGIYGLTAPGPCSTTANTAARQVLTLQNPSQGKFIGTLNLLNDGGTASYNALLLSLQHRFANHFTVLGNYTWSHCIGDLTTTELSGPSYSHPNDRRADRGNCPYTDIRHIVNVSMVAQSPKFSGRLTRALASDWQLAGIVAYNSGTSFSVTTGADNALVGVNATAGVSNQRPNQVLADPYCPNKGVSCWLNPAAFKAPDPGTFGSLGNTNLLGPAYFNIDLALSRMFSVTEKQRIEIRAEAFNIQNRVNFSNPATITYPNGPTAALTNNTFGRITADVSPRIMQFAIKYVF